MGRTAAVAAVLIVVVAVAAIVLGGGSTYQVRAVFQNASQIVNGDLVQVSGTSIGTVSDIALTSNGQARLTLQINNQDFMPLRQGTTATIRQTSLSGIANRYVDLRLGPGGAAQISNGGVIPATITTSEVDLDQIFNTLDGPTRSGLQNVIQGSASQLKGQSQPAQLAYQYLNPAIATSSMLFSEINRDTGRFTNFINQSGSLVTNLAQRSGDLTGLVQNLGTTTQALAAQRTALAQTIQRLPGFMRLANTTFVNLRSALDDLSPLVDVSKPVAPKLQKLLVQLRPLAQDAVPTVHDLSNIISRPGNYNDLTDLTRLGVPLAAATVRTVTVNGRTRPGAFPISTTALNQSTPQLAFARPYAVDLTGWFEGFSHPGTVDANGSSSRIVALIGNTNLSTITSRQGDRCPGSMERGALYFPESGYPCNPHQVPPGR